VALSAESPTIENSGLFLLLRGLQDIFTSLPSPSLVTAADIWTIATIIGQILNIVSSILNKNSSITYAILRALTETLERVFDAASPYLIKYQKLSQTRGDIESMHDKALSGVLQPIIQSMPTLSQAFATEFIKSHAATKTKKPRRPPIDLRPDSVLLFRAVFNGLRILAVPGWSDTVALEIIHAVQKLIQDEDTDEAQNDNSSRDSTPDHKTVRNLATKDAFWYLCAMLLVIWKGEANDTPSSHHLGAFLKNSVETSLCHILRESETKLDDDQYDMLLGCTEQYWVHTGLM
jgi:hypothetical protein